MSLEHRWEKDIHLRPEREGEVEEREKGRGGEGGREGEERRRKRRGREEERGHQLDGAQDVELIDATFTRRHDEVKDMERVSEGKDSPEPVVHRGQSLSRAERASLDAREVAGGDMKMAAQNRPRDRISPR